MLYDDAYDYLLIDETSFNMRYLNAKDDGSIIRKYSKVFYKENGIIKNKDIVDIDLKIDNIIVKYDIEEIDTTNTYWDSEYSKCYFYKVNGIGYFMKIKYLEDNNNNEQLKELISEYDSNYRKRK